METGEYAPAGGIATEPALVVAILVTGAVQGVMAPEEVGEHS